MNRDTQQHNCPECKRPASECYHMPCLVADTLLRSAKGAAQWFRMCGYRALARRKPGAARWSVQVLG